MESLSAAATDPIFGVLCNSGCANAVTGAQGLADAYRLAEITRSMIGGQALVMSTGVIGAMLNMPKLENAIPGVYEQLGQDEDSWVNAATAICTTDTRHKLHQARTEISPGV